jgi:hypothetical protein
MMRAYQRAWLSAASGTKSRSVTEPRWCHPLDAQGSGVLHAPWKA